MTTEPPGTPEPTPVPEPTAPQSASPSPLDNMSGQTLVMIASVVVVAVYLIFGLIANEWFPSDEALIAASFALVLSRIGGNPVGSGISTASLTKIAGYVIAVAGLWDFIETLRFGWGGFEDVIAWVLLAAAAVVAFLGARSIES
jgi:hypothetical protein